MLPTSDNLNFTLESLRLVTLFSTAPSEPSLYCDPTPVTFTLAPQKKEESVSGSEEDSTFSVASEKKSTTKRSPLSFDSITVPQATGKSQFSTRCDVVYKKILRDFRRSYISDFNEETGYMKNKRYQPKSYYIECV